MKQTGATLLKELPKQIHNILKNEGITSLRPVQKKALKAGLLEGSSLLICTPTASGKTLVGEMAFTKAILDKNVKALYIVPLKALASEKYREFKRKYGDLMNITISIGDLDSKEPRLGDYDLILCTSEKLDSLMRHHVPWIQNVGCVIVDEVHLLNDPGRGPTLEIILTMLRQSLENLQIIALSATIGNSEVLAEWLEAKLVTDEWRPVPLKKGIYYDGELEFYE